MERIKKDNDMSRYKKNELDKIFFYDENDRIISRLVRIISCGWMVRFKKLTGGEESVPYNRFLKIKHREID